MSERFLIYLVIICVGFLIGVAKFKKLSHPFKWLTFILGCVLLSEGISRILAGTIKNSSPIYHPLVIFQYIGYCSMYYLLLNSERLKKIILFSIPLFVCFAVVNTFYFEPLLTVPVNAIVVSYLSFIVLSLSVFIQMLNEPAEIPIFKQSIFWFNCALLVYSVAFPLYLGANTYFIRHKLNTAYLYSIIYYINVIFYLTLNFSLWLDKKPSEHERK